MSIYENYARIRDERGWTDKEVSKRSGVAQPTFSRWKTGKNSVTLRTLEKIAPVLGITPGAIIDGTLNCASNHTHFSHSADT